MNQVVRVNLTHTAETHTVTEQQVHRYEDGNCVKNPSTDKHHKLDFDRSGWTADRFLDSHSLPVR